VRGLGLGFLIQPLTVSALSRFRAGQYTQGSSLNTVTRFTFTSLGVCGACDTRPESRGYSHRRPAPAGQACFAGCRCAAAPAGIESCHPDAFWLSLVALIPAFLAICFIRVPKPAAQAEEKMKTSGQTVSHVL